MLERVREKLLESVDRGQAVASTIIDRVREEKPKDAEELLILAERIRRCNDDANVWYGSDLHTPDGELFDGGGRFWQCNSKLCPDCLAKQTRRNRKAIKEALYAQRPTSGQSIKFITLTMPNNSLPLQEARALIYDAWSRFRKRDWFKKHIIGGAKSEEFTVTPRGIHYHMHMIALTRYINFRDFRYEWTDCLKNVFEDNGLSWHASTVDGLAIANIKPITSFEAAANEVCKYMTKADSWAKLRSSDLLEVCRIRRFPRMHELFGTFRLAERLKGTSSPEANDAEFIRDDELKHIVHTKCVNDGERVTSWRDQVKALGAAAYLAHLSDEIAEQSILRMEQLKRHYEFAEFRRPKIPYNRDEQIVLARIRDLTRPEQRKPFATIAEMEAFHNAKRR